MARRHLPDEDSGFESSDKSIHDDFDRKEYWRFHDKAGIKFANAAYEREQEERAARSREADDRSPSQADEQD